MPKAKASGGRTFSKTCLVSGRETEGRKAILVRKRVNSRIAPIGPDGLTMDGSETVPTSSLVDVQPVLGPTTAPVAPIPRIMGDRGTLTIPSELCRALDLQPGTPVLIEVRGDAIVIHPAEIKRRSAGSTPSLEDLVARITPENRHEEISTGHAVGREID